MSATMLVAKFEEGFTLETGSDIPSTDYLKYLPQIGEASKLIKRIERSEEPAAIASAIEFVLEGLHLNRRINRDQSGGHIIYTA